MLDLSYVSTNRKQYQKYYRLSDKSDSILETVKKLMVHCICFGVGTKSNCVGSGKI